MAQGAAVEHKSRTGGRCQGRQPDQIFLTQTQRAGQNPFLILRKLGRAPSRRGEGALFGLRWKLLSVTDERQDANQNQSRDAHIGQGPGVAKTSELTACEGNISLNDIVNDIDVRNRRQGPKPALPQKSGLLFTLHRATESSCKQSRASYTAAYGQTPSSVRPQRFWLWLRLPAAQH